MKDKNVAAILALFLGSFGIHRFYLNQTGLGILYCVLAVTGISAILGFIDALVFLTKDKDEFDLKYNRKHLDVRRRYPHDTDFDRRDRDFRRGYREERQERKDTARQERRERRSSHQKQERTARRKPQRTVRPTANPFRQEGVQKFKDFDYVGAIEAFERALEINPQDVAVHFNLACTYSLTENKKEALYHIDKAVAYGFKDFKRIREHDALAWLRIQDEFSDFAANNFRLTSQKTAAPKEVNLLETRPDLLEQIKKLSELRNKGFLTEAEFAAQKRKLMG
jgi:TM2 domain-containing membrane protein YozV/Flp pilus assembly protein TadD